MTTGTWHQLIQAKGGTLDFDTWLVVTQELEANAFGIDVLDFPTPEDRADWWTQMLYAIQCETVEMGDELGYKFWDKQRGVRCDREKVISEAADLLHFVALILASVECSGYELSEAYMQKIAKNYARQAQAGGDDVAARRCGSCGRSLDDVGTFTKRHADDSIMIYCSGCGAQL